jgi:hypothetical protein
MLQSGQSLPDPKLMRSFTMACFPLSNYHIITLSHSKMFDNLIMLQSGQSLPDPKLYYGLYSIIELSHYHIITFQNVAG